MRTFFSIFLGLSLFLGSSQLQAHLPWATKHAEVMEKAQKENKPVILFFTGTGWCTWCVKLEREVLDMPEFANALNNQFLFLKADFPNPSEPAIASSQYKPLMDRYHVDGFPTLVVVNAKGDELFTMGYEAGGPQKYAEKLLMKLRMSGQK